MTDQPVDRSRRSAWAAAVALALLTAGTAVLLGFTLLDLPFQQAFGAWNYLLAGALVVATVVPLRAWRPDDRYRADVRDISR
jgi:hypothetical protein